MSRSTRPSSTSFPERYATPPSLDSAARTLEQSFGASRVVDRVICDRGLCRADGDDGRARVDPSGRTRLADDDGALRVDPCDPGLHRQSVARRERGARLARSLCGRRRRARGRVRNGRRRALTDRCSGPRRRAGDLSPCGVRDAVRPPADPIDRAIARALGITLFFLAVALGLGYAQSLSLERGTPVAMRLAPVHADLALIGWLSLLVVGVSSRTLRPITGNPARQPALHIAVGTAGVLGVVVSSLGLLWNAVALIWGGAAILAVALLLYVAQVIRIFSGLQNPHRPPQAFALASVGWLIVGGYLGMSAAFGRPAGTAFIFVALVGWIGQMVVAHIHHIGIRLIATIVRGDEDETRPIELLDGRLSWPCFVLFQSAVAAGTVGLLGASARAIEVAGLCGIVGWTLMSANLILAWRNAHRPATIVLVSPPASTAAVAAPEAARVEAARVETAAATPIAAATGIEAAARITPTAAGRIAHVGLTGIGLPALRVLRRIRILCGDDPGTPDVSAAPAAASAEELVP